MFAPTLDLGVCALGRAIDACGRPLDGGRALSGRRVPVRLQAPCPNEREPIGTPLWTGVRVIDGLLTIGRGSRIGIFGAPGSGKSTLAESIVDGCDADAVVVGLIGERGREAQRWISLRDDRTTIVCATSDRPALERVRAADVAVAQAQALRERELHVVLVLDSLARIAAALRELRLANGEIAARGGYPPSVFAQLAAMVEVAGELAGGSITLVATVLSDGDDRDPVSEAARSFLDGHITLSWRLAQAGRFPAVEVLASASRTMAAIASEQHRHTAKAIRHAIAALGEVQDARAVGIETSDPFTRAAIAAEADLEAFLRQESVRTECDVTLSQLAALAASLEERRANR